jgi:hypothetical protein
MRQIGMATALALSLVGLVGHEAKATTITQNFDFTATQFSAHDGSAIPKDTISGAFTLTYDNAQSYTNASSGLVFSSINMPTMDPLVFSFNPAQKVLTVGANGQADQYVWGTNDFLLSVVLGSKGPSGGFFGYSLDGHHDSYETYHVAVNVSTTPIPASVLMLMTGMAVLGGLGWMRARRESTAGFA